MDDPVSKRELQHLTKEANALFGKHREAINQHALAIDRLSKDMLEVLRDKHADHYKSIVRNQLTEAQRYSSVVVGVGYAGYFALWSLVKGEVPAAPHALSGIFIVLSVGAFVAWEVYRMAGMAFDAAEIERLLESEPDLASSNFGAPDHKMVNAVLELRQARLLRWWPVALAFSVGPAALGTLAMVWALVAKLVQAL